MKTAYWIVTALFCLLMLAAAAMEIFGFIIHERIRRHAKTAMWEDFARANADLLSGRNNILTKYYRAETLASDFARNVFVLPDNRLSSESR